MTDQEYRDRIIAIERYCNRLSIGHPADTDCPIASAERWEHHAKAVMDYLTSCVEAEYYGVPRPVIDSGISHLNELIKSEQAQFGA